MALNFPNSPTINEVYTGPNGNKWSWTGESWVSLGTQTSPSGGSNTQVQFNNDGVLSGTANLTFDVSSNAMFAYAVEIATDLNLRDHIPSPPPAANVSMFGRSIGGRLMPAFMGPSGLDSVLQPHIARNRVSWIQWVGTAALANTQVGFPVAPTYLGTVTMRTPDATSLYQSIRRLGLVSAATAGSNGYVRIAASHWLRGNVADMGGFHWISRFGVADPSPVANALMFVGFTGANGAIANSTNPTTLANTIGVGQIPSSNNLQIITNRSQATGYTIDTGLLCNVGNTAIWDVAMFSAPNDDKVQFTIQNLANSAQSYYTSVVANSTNLPLGNTTLIPQMWRSNNTAASVVAIDVISLYIETDT